MWERKVKISKEDPDDLKNTGFRLELRKKFHGTNILVIVKDNGKIYLSMNQTAIIELKDLEDLIQEIKKT